MTAESTGKRPEYGSDVLVDLLTDLGVDLIAFTPGATFRGLHDSLVHNPGGPEIVVCLHEEISVAVAHGYAKATGRIPAVAIHNVVGLQHASMAVYNAWCDQVPMLLIGGTGPLDAARHRPWIDGIHTANPQASQIRDYTKWDDQPASLAALPESVIRAYRLAGAMPQGPVYVCVDSAIQEERVGQDHQPARSASYAAPSAAWPDPAVIEQLADRLIAAEMPVILAERVDRDQQALEALVALAELLCVPVREVERDYNRSGLCFPTAHWLNFTGVALPVEPDAVLALHAGDLREFGEFGEEVWVAEVSTALIRARGWMADLQRIHPAAITIPAAARPVLDSVLPLVRDRLATDGDARERAETRRGLLTGKVDVARTRWRAEAAGTPERSDITRPYLATVLDDMTAGHRRVLANGSLHNWVQRLWELERSDDYLGGSGGAGLGYGLGASIGAALAYRNTGALVIDIQSDGDALMTPSALWTAARYQVPLLMVMDNNRRYDNSVQHARRIARTRGRAGDLALVGTGLTDPAVDFVALAQSFGVSGMGPVSRRADLADTLRSAVDVVLRDQCPVLVDVITTADL